MSNPAKMLVTTGSVVGQQISLVVVDGSFTYLLSAASSFVGTILLRMRPFLDPSGSAWTNNTSGYATIATLTAASVPATDELTGTVGGGWEIQLYLSAYTSGDIQGTLSGKGQ